MNTLRVILEDFIVNVGTSILKLLSWHSEHDYNYHSLLPDNHVRSMIEGDDIDGLKQLVLDGYDSLQLVIDNIDRETQSEDVQLSLETIQTFKVSILFGHVFVQRKHCHFV